MHIEASLQVEEEPVPENPRYPLPNIDIPEDIRVLLRSQDGEEFSYASGKEILAGTYSTVVMNKKTRLEGTLVIPNDIEAQSVVSLIASLNKTLSKKVSKRKMTTNRKKKVSRQRKSSQRTMLNQQKTRNLKSCQRKTLLQEQTTEDTKPEELSIDSTGKRKG